MLRITKLDPRARLPEYYDGNSIGLDVFAFLLTEHGRATSRAIHNQGITEIPTGIRVHPPPGYLVEVTSKLHLARAGIIVANAPALIGEMNQGELSILLFNTTYATQYIAHEHRIAQLFLREHLQYPVTEHKYGEPIPAPQHSEDVHSGPRQGDS